MDIDSSSKPGLSAMMPLAAGLLGVLIGVIALFMALQQSAANRQSAPDQLREVADMHSPTDSLKSVSGDIASLKQQLVATAGKQDALTTSVQSWLSDFNKQVSGALSTINDKVDKLGTRAPVAGSTSHATASETAVTSAGGTHAIVAGDTLSNLAKKYNVSLTALEAANPGVDSSHLKIGQVITIPASKPASASPAARSSAASASPSSAASTGQ